MGVSVTVVTLTGPLELHRVPAFCSQRGVLIFLLPYLSIGEFILNLFIIKVSDNLNKKKDRSVYTIVCGLLEFLVTMHILPLIMW